MKKKGRRLCSTLLSLSMVAGLLSPGTASAAEGWKNSALSHVLSETAQELFGGGISDLAEGNSFRLLPATNTNAIDDLVSVWTKATESSIIKATDSNAEVATSSNAAAYSNGNNLGAALEVYPLKDIIGFDGDAMYTTLLDENGTVISTNDPRVNEPENPGEVKAGDAVSVKFRMEDIIPNDGDDGVQENRVYAMSLPDELIPAAENADGEQLVNPAEPLKFFGDEDGIQAFGGIYNVGGEYQLRMIFKNVEDWIDISGYFQYGANVSTTVIPGETYELEYVPGGTIHFTVAKDSPSVRYGDYTLSMGGGSGGLTAYYWQVNINKEEKTDDTSKTSSESETESDPLIFPFRELTIDSEDAMGVWVNEENQGIFDAYGDGNGPGCSLGITYETEDEEGDQKSKYVIADAGSVIENEKGKTVIRFSADDIQADMEFRKDDAVADTIVQNSHDQFAYITNKIYVHISDGNGGNAKNIKSLTLYVPTLTYDDYCQTGEVYYAGNAVLSVKAEESENTGEDTGETGETAEEITDGSEEKKETVEIPDVKDVEASGSVKVYYNNLTAPSVTGGSRDPSNSYEYLPEDIYTRLGSGNASYRGNYYWMEFDPAVENSSGANYYLGNWSFLPGNYFWASSDSSNYATFGTSGSGLYGMTGASGFEYLRKVSVAQIKQDPNLVAHILTSEGGTDEKPQLDVKLQYQLKKVFAQASEDSDVIIYRSTTPHNYGEYSYLVIDPQTVKTAQQNNNKGWREYVDGTYNYSKGGYSAKAASFKIHIFNAPYTTLQLEAIQKIGSVISDDNNYTSSREKPTLTDQVKNGIKTKDGEDAEKYTTKSSYEFDKYQSSYMEGVWADDDTIFWKMTFDTTNWPSSSAQQGSIYVNAGQKLRMMTSYYKDVLVEGQQLNTKQMYVKNPSSGNWESINIPSSDNSSWDNQATSEDMIENTTLSSSRSDNTYRFQYQGVDWNQYQTSYLSSSPKDVTVGFFTHVDSLPGIYEEPKFSCTAEVVVRNGDVSKLHGDYRNQFPDCGQGDMIQFPFKISATGETPIPSMNKNGNITTVENSGSKMTAAWKIEFDNFKYPNHTSSLIVNSYYGGYSGVMSVTDDMKDSEVTDIHGEPVNNVYAGKYTYVTTMFCAEGNNDSQGISINEIQDGGTGGGGCGQIPYEVGGGASVTGDSEWKKYENGQWVSMTVGHAWDPYKPGMYRRILSSSHSESKPLEVYVFYAGNLYDSVVNSLGSQLASIGRNPGNETYSHSLVVEYRGLERVQYVSPVKYTTEFDQDKFREAADEATKKDESQKLASFYDVELKNSAGFGYWRNYRNENATVSVERKVSAGLSIQKTAKAMDRRVSGYTDGFTGDYTVKVVNGVSSSQYLGVEDFLTGFSNENSTDVTYSVEGETPSAVNIAAVKALTRHCTVKNLVITAKADGTTDASTIYRDGAFISEWGNSTLTLKESEDYSSEKPGSLFILRLEKASGEIPANMEFMISYSMKLDMDTIDPELGDQSFRASDYYAGQGLRIDNNAEAFRTYTPLQNPTRQRAKASTPGGTISGEILKVDCGGSVESTYLTRDMLEKKFSGSTDSNISNWLSIAYTGTMGKGGSADGIKISDMLSFTPNKFSVKDPNSSTMYTVSSSEFSEPMKSNLETLLEHLVETYSTYKDIKLYYMDKKPASKDELQDTDLIWEVPQGVSGGTEITDGRLYYPDDVKTHTARDLEMDLTLGGTPASGTQQWAGDPVNHPGVRVKVTSFPASLSIASTDPWKLSHGHTGFTVEAEGLEREKYLVAVYQVETDWTQVYAEATRILGGVSYSGNLENVIEDGLGAHESSRGSQVSITDSSLQKAVNNSQPTAGTAQWVINISTGTQDRDELTVEDHFQVQFPEDSTLSEEDKDRIQKAVMAATSIDPASVVITRGNLNTIYSKGTSQAGWEDNLEVSVEDSGKTLKITIKNQPGDEVLKASQSYKITYNTVFDKGLFIKNGGKKDDKYNLANTAAMNYGGLQKSDTVKREFYPNIPIDADKSPGTSDGNTQQWTATAYTRDAERTEFTLTDEVGVEPGENDAWNAALYLSAWSVKVIDASDGEKEYVLKDDEEDDNEDNDLPEGVVLTDLNNNPLKLGKPGIRGFILKFDRLPAGCKVQVTYVTAIDESTLPEADRKDGTIVHLRNNFNVSAADGNGKEISAPGRVTIKTPFVKTGDATEAGKTADGNPILTWSMNVNLTSLYTVEK